MFTRLASLFMERAVGADTAMTGEISLRGLVLPVGGIKEKVLAAMRAGIHRVMLPARNRKDLEEVPAEAKEKSSSCSCRTWTRRCAPPNWAARGIERLTTRVPSNEACFQPSARF